MSNRLFEGIVHQMSQSIERTIGIIDETSAVVASSDLSKVGEAVDIDFAELVASEIPVVIGDYTYFGFGTMGRNEYAVCVEGNDAQASKYASLLSISLSSVKQYYDEKHDRANFIKNVILDNILPGDIYLKSRELHFVSEISRVVMLIRIVSRNDVSVYEVVQKLFPDKHKDFVININETDIALVKEVPEEIETKDLENLARSIVDTLSSEFYTHAVVGIGTKVTGVKDLARSFKEANVALEVGKVFDNEKAIVSCESLAISCPPPFANPSCGRYLKKIPSKASIRRLFSPFSVSSTTTSTFPKPRESCLYTATPWYIVLKRSKSSPAST